MFSNNLQYLIVIILYLIYDNRNGIIVIYMNVIWVIKNNNNTNHNLKTYLVGLGRHVNCLYVTSSNSGI